MTPLATDIYVIVLPSIARDFGAGLAATQRTMVTFALGFGLAQLFVGVAADRWGRRPVAITGLALFLAASIAVIRAPDLDSLALCRFLQGAFAATCPILSRALVRDAVPHHGMARAYASTNVLIGVAPLVAPFLGAWANAWGGWRAALGLLIVYGATLAVTVAIWLPETRPKTIARTLAVGVSSAPTPFAAAGQILGHPHFLIGSTAATMHYAALFTWLTTSPFLLMDRMGFSTTAVASVYGTGAALFIATNMLTARLAQRHTSQRMLVWGAVLMLAGSITTWLALTRPGLGTLQLILAMTPFYVGLGFAHPNALQTVMRPFAHIAGQASAWLGLIQQTGAVIVSLIAVSLGAGLSAVGVMTICSVLLLLAARRLERMPT
jgi:MFS transporter, DHA1 family, multidrug resistance protein